MKPHRFNIGEKMDGFPAHTWNWLIDAVTALQNSQKRLENITRPTSFDNRGVVVDFIIDRSEFGKVDPRIEEDSPHVVEPVKLGVGSIIGLMGSYIPQDLAGHMKRGSMHPRSGNIVLKGHRPRKNDFDPGVYAEILGEDAENIQGWVDQVGGLWGAVEEGVDPTAPIDWIPHGRDPVLGVVVDVDPEMYAEGSATREHVGLEPGADVATGRAIICGAAHVLLDVKDPTHEFAEVAPAWRRAEVVDGKIVEWESRYGSIAGLQSCATGHDGIRILWAQKEDINDPWNLGESFQPSPNLMGVQQAIVLLQMAPSKVIDRHNMVYNHDVIKGFTNGVAHSGACTPIEHRGRPLNYEELNTDEKAQFDNGSQASFSYGNNSHAYAGKLWNLSPHTIGPGPVSAMRIDPKGSSGPVYAGVPINMHAVPGFNAAANQSVGHDASSESYPSQDSSGNPTGYTPEPTWQNDGSC